MLLNQLKEKFSEKFSPPQNNIHFQKEQYFKSHAYFYTAYLSSVRMILSESPPDSVLSAAAQGRGRALHAVLLQMRHTGTEQAMRGGRGGALNHL
jgi:hypothetical protein